MDFIKNTLVFFLSLCAIIAYIGFYLLMVSLPVVVGLVVYNAIFK
jgi:hypothetical protein